jgi:hypothetical protein
VSQFQDFFDKYEPQITSMAIKFGSYVFPIEASHIRNWLRQFGEDNLELGLKLLNNVDYFSPSRLINESRELHNQLLAYKNINQEDLIEKPIYFVDFSPSSGRSQDDFIPKYRLGSGLRENKYDENFIYLRDVNQFLDKKDITLVFITDFIGSGKQVIDTWKNILWAISPDNEHILLSICGYVRGIQRIEKEYGGQLTVITNRRYGDECRIFSDENSIFSPNEKTVLKSLCDRIDDYPSGFQDTQSITVFYFRCPNNVISILRANNPPNWVGLFKRHLSE